MPVTIVWFGRNSPWEKGDQAIRVRLGRLTPGPRSRTMLAVAFSISLNSASHDHKAMPLGISQYRRH